MQVVNVQIWVMLANPIYMYISIDQNLSATPSYAFDTGQFIYT